MDRPQARERLALKDDVSLAIRFGHGPDFDVLFACDLYGS